MRASYQHKVIGQYLHSRFGHLREWPFSSSSDLERELCRRSISLAAGDFLVVGLDRDGIRCGTVAGLQGLAAFSRDSLVVSYYELERAFYEQHSDWGEV